ncbi:MAG: B12-binding domain-containing radical SAM protein [Candidatus Omnitrophica bacterium]|nr:B12-binding domain-containing radical SAM protein [Candidatus Omnitrophota bacterium]
MKVVFINPSLRPDSKRRQLPVGLAYIVTAVKKAGFDFDLIDMDINQLTMQDLEETLGRNTYEIYAIGCIVTGFKLIKEIAEIIKRTNPASIIIAGNSVATSIPEILLSNTKVDIAVMGEGDIAIVDLLRTLETKGEISNVVGIAFKKNGKTIYTPKRHVVSNIDILGFPDWDIFEIEKYNAYGAINVDSFTSDRIISFPLNTARGCPFNCTFCYHVFKGERYRKYSEDRAIEEIKRLHHEYNCSFVCFWDELSFLTIKSVKSLAERLSRLEFKIEWEATTRGDLFRKEHIGLIKDLKSLSCKTICFSLENASPEILKAINKRMDVAQFIEQSKALWKGGITPLTSVIFGYPQETPETIKRTLDVCEECGMYPSTGFLLPLPATPIYDWAKKNAYIPNEVEYLEKIGDRQDFHINLTKMSDEDFISTVESGLRALAEKQGLKLESVFKTTTYQKPKTKPKITKNE